MPPPRCRATSPSPPAPVRVERFGGDGIRLPRIWCFSLRHSHLMASRGCGIRVRGWNGFILDNAVVKDNVLHQAALEELISDLGGHGEQVIIRDNPGSLKGIAPQAG